MCSKLIEATLLEKPSLSSLPSVQKYLKQLALVTYVGAKIFTGQECWLHSQV